VVICVYCMAFGCSSFVDWFQIRDAFHSLRNNRWIHFGSFVSSSPPGKSRDELVGQSALGLPNGIQKCGHIARNLGGWTGLRGSRYRGIRCGRSFGTGMFRWSKWSLFGFLGRFWWHVFRTLRSLRTVVSLCIQLYYFSIFLLCFMNNGY